jgi:hypothetical protein
VDVDDLLLALGDLGEKIAFLFHEMVGAEPVFQVASWAVPLGTEFGFG